MGVASIVRGLWRAGRAGLGVIVAAAVAVLALMTGFLEPVSLSITLGGTFTVMWLTFSRQRLASTWQQLTAALDEESDPEEVILAIKRLARVHRLEGALSLERAAATEADPQVHRSITLALECRDEDELADVLFAEARRSAAEGEAARHVLITLGKLFPAFGLIGTLIGLVLLLRHLAGANVAAIGPGLGIAVLTTLYGAVMSNVVVLPLATKLQAHLTRQALRTQMIVEGVLLVQRQEYPTRIERVLRGYVGASPAEGARHVIGLTDHAA